MTNEKEHAEKTAQELCDTLGDGWEPDVWENLGWHCAARFGGVLYVLPPSHPEGIYTAYLRDYTPDLDDLGRGFSFNNCPKEACKEVIKKAEQEQARRQAIIDKAKGSTGSRGFKRSRDGFFRWGTRGVQSILLP